jgi:predicted phosphohydrolase
MDIFGDRWVRHHEKIRNEWQQTVAADDWVLLPGDISWAMRLEEAKPDLEFLGELPGRKIIIRGNHDYWWSTISKVRKILPPGMHAIQNDSILIGDIAICGTRGWNCPGGHDFGEHDQQIYEREVSRLELSLQTADRRAKEKWVMLHYPPVNEKHQDSGFLETMRKHSVTVCIYGHLHGDGHRNALLGERDGIRFQLASSDYLNFKPLQLK